MGHKIYSHKIQKREIVPTTFLEYNTLKKKFITIETGKTKTLESNEKL